MRLLRAALAVALGGLLVLVALPVACVNAALLAEIRAIPLPGAGYFESSRLARCARLFGAVDHTLAFLPVRAGASPQSTAWRPALQAYSAAHPGDALALLALAEAHLQAGDLDLALPLYARLADAEALYYHASAAAAAGDYELSERYAQLVVALAPEWAAGWYQLAEAQYHSANPAAQASYQAALKWQPAPNLAAKIYVRLGSLLARGGDAAGAWAHFQTALALDPRSWSAMEQLSRLELARGDPAAACHWAQRAAQIAPDEFWVVRLLTDLRETTTCAP